MFPRLGSLSNLALGAKIEADMRRRMDVVIAGVPKSGTSMLCNAMTVPGRAVVLYEPTAVGSGWSDSGAGRQPGLSGPEYPRLGPQAREMGGQRGFRRLIRKAVEWGPEHVVLLVRDLRHVALSTYETNQRIPWDLDYRRQRLLASAEAVMELRRTHPSDRLTICRYEEFVANPEYREVVRQRANWPTLDGDVGRGLSTWLERPHEADRHNGSITANSVAYRRSPQGPEAERFARDVVSSCASFNEMFGYEV